jgi:hypothetical protein
VRAAPAVRVSVKPGAVARGVPALMVLLASAAFAAWLLARLGHAPAWGLLPALPAAALAWRLGAGPARVLEWDGRRWHCDGRPGHARLQLDLQGLLLLRWTADAAASGQAGPAGGLKPALGCWLVPTAVQCGARWHALRVALVAGAGPARLDPPLTP